jgi:23S rRNA (uracil1939-C5)-methyltransferase
MLEVNIESLVYTGAGLGRLPDGKVVFVPGALPGELATVELTADKGRYANASLVEIVDKSPERIDPACPHYATCGGCPWQVINYQAQLAWKRRFVVDALTRIGKLAEADTLVSEPLASPASWHYRNKVEFALVADPRGRLALGTHEARSNLAKPIKQCLLLPKALAELPETLSGTLNYALASEATKPYRVAIRHSTNSSQTELALYSTPSGMRRAFVAKLLGDTGQFSSIVRVLTKSDDASRDVRKTEVLHGRGHWSERLSGIRYTVSAASFFQVNTAVAEHMVNHLLQLAKPKGKHIWDLYCGVGTFTLPLARSGATVSAVEIAGSSLRDLERNLANAALDDAVDVYPGDVARVIAEPASGLQNPELIIADPPAAGMDATVVDAIAASGTSMLIYVSCDPQTLARDTARLTEHGYRLIEARLFDLFPQTYHVETIALFTK